MRIILLFLFLSNSIFSQPSTNSSVIVEKKITWFPKTTIGGKHGWYFYWGYNRASFNDSNLHVFGPDYDLTFYDLKATDRPTPFSLKGYFSIARLSIPQYNYRIGRRLRGNWFASIGADHLKYVVVKDQPTRVSGIISENASTKYAGVYLNQPIVLSEYLLRFEHSDGLTLVSLDIDWGLPLAKFGQFSASLRPGIGGVWAVCRTDVAVFDDHKNTDFHLAGYSFQGKTTVEIDWRNRFFFAWGVKTGYVSLPDILIKDKNDPRRAEQNIEFFERFGVLGVRF